MVSDILSLRKKVVQFCLQAFNSWGRWKIRVMLDGTPVELIFLCQLHSWTILQHFTSSFFIHLILIYSMIITNVMI